MKMFSNHRVSLRAKRSNLSWSASTGIASSLMLLAMTIRRMLKSEAGQALPMTLILLVLGGLLVVPTLSFMTTNLNANRQIDRATLGLYAADSGVEDALRQLKYTESGPVALYKLGENVNLMSVEIATIIKGDYTLYAGEFVELSQCSGRLQIDTQIGAAPIEPNIYEYTIIVHAKAQEPGVCGGHINLKELGTMLPVGYEYVAGSAALYPSAGEKLIGVDDTVSYSGSAPKDTLLLSKFTADKTGTVDTFRVNCSTKNQKVKVAIYSADAVGEPGTLLKNTECTSTVAGWNDITFPDPKPSVTAGTSYWLAAISDAAVIGYKTFTSPDTWESRTKTGQTYSSFTFPSTLTGLTTVTDKQYLFAGYSPKQLSTSNPQPEWDAGKGVWKLWWLWGGSGKRITGEDPNAPVTWYQRFRITGTGNREGAYSWVEATRTNIDQVGEISGTVYIITATATKDGQTTAKVMAEVLRQGSIPYGINVIAWEATK